MEKILKYNSFPLDNWTSRLKALILLDFFCPMASLDRFGQLDFSGSVDSPIYKSVGRVSLYYIDLTKFSKLSHRNYQFNGQVSGKLTC
jgi:hypothetical protein